MVWPGSALYLSPDLEIRNSSGVHCWLWKWRKTSLARRLHPEPAPNSVTIKDTLRHVMAHSNSPWFVPSPVLCALPHQLYGHVS